MPMSVTLDGKVALVTGASRNIGKAIADTLAANGATVIYADRLVDEAKAAAAKVPRGIGLAMDVSDEAGVERAMAEAVKTCGRLDILVNNAGINTSHRVPIDDFPLSEWEKIVGIDMTGLFLVSRAAVKVMRKQKGGRIINISSVLGLVPARLQCAFTAAKAGVVNLTRAMAIELGAENILVNCIAPGSILTEGTRSLFYADAEKAKRMLAHVPLGRPGECPEIAHAVLFLAAPEASYITGQTLAVDGGWTAGYLRDF